MATCNERVRKMRKNLIMCGIPSSFAAESVGCEVPSASTAQKSNDKLST